MNSFMLKRMQGEKEIPATANNDLVILAIGPQVFRPPGNYWHTRQDKSVVSPKDESYEVKREHLIEKLQYYENMGLIKHGETARILSLGMENKGIIEYFGTL